MSASRFVSNKCICLETYFSYISMKNTILMLTTTILTLSIQNTVCFLSFFYLLTPLIRMFAAGAVLLLIAIKSLLDSGAIYPIKCQFQSLLESKQKCPVCSVHGCQRMNINKIIYVYACVFDILNDRNSFIVYYKCCLIHKYLKRP